MRSQCELPSLLGILILACLVFVQAPIAFADRIARPDHADAPVTSNAPIVVNKELIVAQPQASQPVLLPDLPKGPIARQAVALPDPKLADQFPTPPVPAAVQAVNMSITRANLVQSLLGDQSYAKSLSALPTLTGIQPLSLAHTSMTGVNITMSTGMVPGAPTIYKSYDDINWHNGVSFTPTDSGPMFSAGGKSYRVGGVFINGACMIPGTSLRDLSTANLIYLKPPCQVWVFLELPPDPGAYMISMKLAESRGASLAGLVGGNPVIFGDVVDKNGTTPLRLVAVNTQGAITCLCNITPVTFGGNLNYESQQYWGMRGINSWACFQFYSAGPGNTVWHPRYYLYGGITVHKL